MTEANFDVIVVGAGPVGLTLAIDLGRRGVKTLLLERDETTKQYPKMDRSNARTMEMYRRLGIADRVRELGYPPEVPMDVFCHTRLCEEPLAVMRYPSVGEWRKRIAACRNGSLPLEPYQLVAQNDLEPLLKVVAEATPNVTVQFGCELTKFEQDEAAVEATVLTNDGIQRSIRSRYLVGTDGASSTVRKALGIQLSGRGNVAQQTQVIFRSKDLWDKLKFGKGRHFNFVDPRASTLVAQGSRREFTLHSPLPADSDFATLIREIVGFDFEFEIRCVIPWRLHLLLADRYREGRVFLAGDAIHLVIPTGGLGMNSGVGDALNLSWKLAAVVHGWGGETLLDSYELERRPVAQRNIEAAGWAAEGQATWRRQIEPWATEKSMRGEQLRHQLSESFGSLVGRMHGMIGVELGYTYADSPVIADEDDKAADWAISSYTAHARPGVRIPHMWLSDGRALQDALGDDYTLLDLTGQADTIAIEGAFETIGAPLAVLRLDEPSLRDVYESSLLLLRPDLHVAWRGHRPPEDPENLGLMVTGNNPARPRPAISWAKVV